MSETYIQRVARETPTRFWINNPTGEELGLAVSGGAVSGTTNPTYASNLLKREADYVQPIMDGILADVSDDMEAADLLYQKITERFLKGFLPRYESSEGKQGFVTTQDDPCRDGDAGLILGAALRHAQIAPNYLAKIPVIPSGMEAMEELIRRNMPICATESFAMAQMTTMCDLYERMADETGNAPAFFITHITGIFDEEMQAIVERDEIDIDPAILKQAGAIVARKQYRIIKERGYRTTMLGGGARGTHHFTEFVGGDMHITMNWSTIQELNEQESEVVPRMDTETPRAIIDELSEKIPCWRQAYEDNGLAPEEFDDYPPLQRFRRAFVSGCEKVLEAIEERRKVLG